MPERPLAVRALVIFARSRTTALLHLLLYLLGDFMHGSANMKAYEW